MSISHRILKCGAACAIFASSIISTASAQGISTLRDAEIEEFLDDYSEPIFRAAGLPENSIKILIVNDQSFNAFAGGRYMGVNSGLLTIADAPNQVEAVIAHEAGHLAGGHTARSDEMIAQATRPMLLGLILAAGAIAAGAPDVGVGVLGLGQNVGIANFLRYSRGQEAAADQASITYLDSIGHSSKGALDLWRKMRNSQIIRGDAINPYFQSHPLANQRLSSLQTRAEASPHFNKTDSPEELARFRLIQAKIRGFLTDPHSVLRRYPLSDQSDPAHYARSVAYFRNSEIEKALSEIRTLTELYPDNPYFHELEGQILFEYGRVAEAIGPHSRAVEIVGDNALLRISLARALLASQEKDNLEKSIQELKRALLLEPDNSFGWFELARAYSANDNEAMANLATAESRYNAGAHPDAVSFARRAMAGLDRNSREWRQAADIIIAATPSDKKPVIPEFEPPEKSEQDPDENSGYEKSDQDVPDPTLTIIDSL